MRAADKAVDAAKGADKAMDAGKKASTMAENAKNGKAFESVATEEVGRRSSEKIATQVTVKPNGGDKNVRLDNVSTRDGKTVLSEAKSSNSAPLTKNQGDGFPLIEKFGGVIVGKNGERFGYKAGDVVPVQKVEIIRPNDIKSK